MNHTVVPKNLVIQLADLGWESDKITKLGYFKSREEDKDWELRTVSVENLLEYKSFIPAPTMREISEWISQNSPYQFYIEKDYDLYTGYIESSNTTTVTSKTIYTFRGYLTKGKCLEDTLKKIIEILDKNYYI